MRKSKEIATYINKYPKDIKSRLNFMRGYIFEILPDVEEKISYQMPTYRKEKVIFHFAAWKNHIAIYPTPDGVEKFEKELKEYKTTKGTIIFPNDKEFPEGLIKKIINHRASSL